MTEPGPALLDSTLLIQLSRGDRRATRYLSSFATVRLLGTSAVNVAEVTRRAHLQERILWRDVWRVLSVWPVTLADGEDAGYRIYDLARRGFQVPLPDALIAAVARRVGATVVTDNVRDFERLDIPVLRPY